MGNVGVHFFFLGASALASAGLLSPPACLPSGLPLPPSRFPLWIKKIWIPLRSGTFLTLVTTLLRLLILGLFDLLLVLLLVNFSGSVLLEFLDTGHVGFGCLGCVGAKIDEWGWSTLVPKRLLRR